MLCVVSFCFYSNARLFSNICQNGLFLLPESLGQCQQLGSASEYKFYSDIIMARQFRYRFFTGLCGRNPRCNKSCFIACPSATSSSRNIKKKPLRPVFVLQIFNSKIKYSCTDLFVYTAGSLRVIVLHYVYYSRIICNTTDYNTRPNNNINMIVTRMCNIKFQ